MRVRPANYSVNVFFFYLLETKINNFDLSQNTIYSYPRLITLSKFARYNKNPEKYNCGRTIVQRLFKKRSNHPGSFTTHITIILWRVFKHFREPLLR